MKKKLLFLIITFTFFNSQAQLLNDNDSKQLIINGLDKLYNFEFKEAEAFFQKVKTKYPKHPVTPLLTAMQLEYQHKPIAQNPKILGQYIQHLEKCQQIAETLYEDPKTKTEATFFLLASHGFVALANHYQSETMRAGKEALKAYGYLKDGFKLMDKNPDFYFTTGMYNFYRIQYPETHPIVKPVMLFFGDGNKKIGLQQLELATQKGIFTRAEAAYYLMGVCFKYENNIQKALQFATWLHERYPNNTIYKMRYVEALVSNAKYDEAQEIIIQLKKNSNKIYQISMNVMDGIIAEKFKKNDKWAMTFYNAALKNQPDYEYTNDYYAMAYCGLARIANRAGDKKKAKEYAKKALEFAEYKTTIAEANRY
jgi:tetratricopeptide (TPR) repeat protein